MATKKEKPGSVISPAPPKPEDYVFGRPTKYKPEFCNRVKELMSEGAALVEICAEFYIDESNLHAWMKKYPNFHKSVQDGKKLSEAWWIKHGRTNLHDTKFQTKLWEINMRNRFKWDKPQSDVQEVTETLKQLSETLEGLVKVHKQDV